MGSLSRFAPRNRGRTFRLDILRGETVKLGAGRVAGTSYVPNQARYRASVTRGISAFVKPDVNCV